MRFTILENIKTSTEFYLLVIVSVCFLYNVNLTLRPNPEFVHQFEDYDELAQNLIPCSDFTQNNNQHAKDPAQPRCLIDDKSLQSFIEFKAESLINYNHIEAGGHFRPNGCLAKQRIAIVVPYRDRPDQLEKFSLYIHQFLPSQLIDYSVFVIEQTKEKQFNRAKLFNVGVAEILKIRNDTCCFIFHDVDLLPLNQMNLYMCSYRPRHMSPSVNTLRFNLLYPELFGGVIAVTREQFESIGGFSNHFYGWGGEDDDMFVRFRTAGYGIDRTPIDIGVYTMIKHAKMVPNPSR